MPKLKTRKAVAKRFKVTAKKKVTRRSSNQNHFNAREDSKHTRLKRSDKEVPGKFAENILIDIVER